jgi:hypothetical protein
MKNQPPTPRTPIFLAEMTPSMSREEVVRRLIPVLQRSGFKTPSVESVLKHMENKDRAGRL